jgi:TPR repeat protein
VAFEKQGGEENIRMRGLRMLGGLAAVLILACAAAAPVVEAEPVEFTLERRFENENPRYKAMSDAERIAVVARWAIDGGGFDGELLALATAVALRGDATAQYVVGVVYKYPEWRRPGSRIEPDSAQAHSWLLKAALAGNPHTAAEVGDNLFQGYGVAPNEEEALRWFETAAEAGHVRAQYLAGRIHLQRYYETFDPEDEEIGREWMELAAENGDEDAIRLLDELDGTEAAHQEHLDSGEESPSENRQEEFNWSFEPVETE